MSTNWRIGDALMAAMISQEQMQLRKK